MPQVYAIGSNIISALGMDTAAHWKAVQAGITGISRYEDTALSNAPFMASRLSDGQWDAIRSHTRTTVPLTLFEQFAATSIRRALAGIDETIDPNETALILSTTKGNIDLLGKLPDEETLLHWSAQKLAAHFGIPAKPITVSHACVSGLVALQYGMRLLQAGRYKHAIVTGCDQFTKFVLNGFQSFQAVSDEACRPFDAARKGITLGEAAATIILSTEASGYVQGLLAGAATTNDANHISGPSRTGAELAMAISRAMLEAGIAAPDIDMISAHGTATMYNDEMEAKAFNLVGLADCPLHSFKGYIGHTLGAAGIVESAMVLASMAHQQLIPSAGFAESGVTELVNVTTEAQHTTISTVLKTASGFGGSNAAVVWKAVRVSA